MILFLSLLYYSFCSSSIICICCSTHYEFFVVVFGLCTQTKLNCWLVCDVCVLSSFVRSFLLSLHCDCWCSYVCHVATTLTTVSSAITIDHYNSLADTSRLQE
jgi:hypothetical protein